MPFPITIDLPWIKIKFLSLVMDALTKHIHDAVVWCMQFADDILLVDETRGE